MRESPKNKQTDGSTRNRPFVILSWKGKGRAHILYRSSAETILSGQLFPVSGYCFADLLCSLFRFLRGQAEIIGYFQSQFQVNGVIILTHIEGKPVPRGDWVHIIERASRQPVGVRRKPWLRRWSSVLDTAMLNTIRFHSSTRSCRGDAPLARMNAARSR